MTHTFFFTSRFYNQPNTSLLYFNIIRLVCCDVFQNQCVRTWINFQENRWGIDLTMFWLANVDDSPIRIILGILGTIHTEKETLSVFCQTKFEIIYSCCWLSCCPGKDTSGSQPGFDLLTCTRSSFEVKKCFLTLLSNRGNLCYVRETFFLFVSFNITRKFWFFTF